ncbi:hypothetical protein [Micromonospora sp. NPDC048843]|uniref:hypothetical protein n=1 Tax=Micromonospora sp. NPDC048843 TaxID=3155389 RepID=UPI00340D12C4
MDVLALKDADIGVAMGAGSRVARTAAQIVLDDSFATLAAVVAEGRRVIGNIERVAAIARAASAPLWLYRQPVGRRAVA